MCISRHMLYSIYSGAVVGMIALILISATNFSITIFNFQPSSLNLALLAAVSTYVSILLVFDGHERAWSEKLPSVILNTVLICVLSIGAGVIFARI